MQDYLNQLNDSQKLPTIKLINNISEGLSGIKNNGTSIPSNITNLKHFKDCNDKDFLSYGSSSKNLYLILLENQ